MLCRELEASIWRTYLDELATKTIVSQGYLRSRIQVFGNIYLGEKVVREKEYRSAMTEDCRK